MRKYFVILLVFISGISFAQSDPYIQSLDSMDEFYREVDWKFYPDSVVKLSDSTYIMIALPYDYNDPGAIDRTVGNYVRDYVGHTFGVIDSLTTDRTITVYDNFKTGQAPQSSQVAKCYSSVMSGRGKEIGSVDYTPLELSARWKLNGMDNERLYRHGTVYDDPFLRTVLDTNYIEQGNEPKGTEFWDEKHRTRAISLGNGVVLQAGQEQQLLVLNQTGDTIKNGRVVGYAGTNNRILVTYASNYERHTFFGAATEDILPDSTGIIVTLSGGIHDSNTGSLIAGLPFYLDTLGHPTNTRPEFPRYVYPLGTVVKEGVTDGTIYFRSDGVNFKDDILNAFDGAIRETFDFRTFSNGTNIYGVLSNPAGDTSLTLMFSDGWWDYAVPDTIVLTAGTSTNPQQSWAYIDKETRTLQSSTSGFPSTEHAEVAKLALLDAATTQADGALRNQNTNNHLKYTNNNGHIVHIGDRVRVLNAQWEDGVALTVSGTPDSLLVSTTSGHVWQMHLQSFASQDMPTNDIHIVNDFSSPYRTTNDMSDVTTYSDGSTWNNAWQNLVIWGVANKSGEASHLMLNLASDGYLTEDDAIDDRNNYANYTIPRAFRGVGFLIARITVKRSPTGYTYNPSTGYLDLRGYYPNNTAGGGTGSSGITEFTQLDDTPNSYIGYGDSVAFVNSGETGIEFRQIQQSDIRNLPDSLLSKQNNITLTTTGNSGASTFDGTTLNVPNYTLDGLGYSVPNLQAVLESGNTATLGATFGDDLEVKTRIDINSDIPILQLNSTTQSWDIRNNANNLRIEPNTIDAGILVRNLANETILSISTITGDVIMSAGATVADAPLLNNDVIRKIDLEDASLDVDFNSIAINTVDINQIISDSTQTAKIDSVVYSNDTLNVVEGGISHKVEIPQMIDSYINGSSFNTGTGVLTLTGTGSAGTSRDLDGRYGILGENNNWTGATNTFETNVRVYGQTSIYTGSLSSASGRLLGEGTGIFTIDGFDRLNLYGDTRLMYINASGIFADFDNLDGTHFLQYNPTTDEITYTSNSLYEWYIGDASTSTDVANNETVSIRPSSTGSSIETARSEPASGTHYISLSLDGDENSPGANKVYGTDGSGVKGWKNDPSGSGTFSGCKATSTVGQTIGSQTSVQFNGEDFDTDSYHDNSTNNTRITIPETGYYSFTFNTFINSGGSTYSLNMLWRKNGSTTAAFYSQILDFTTAYYDDLGVNNTQILYLSSGDYIEVDLIILGSGTLSSSSTTTHLTVHKL